MQRTRSAKRIEQLETDMKKNKSDTRTAGNLAIATEKGVSELKAGRRVILFCMRDFKTLVEVANDDFLTYRQKRKEREQQKEEKEQHEETPTSGLECLDAEKRRWGPSFSRQCGTS